MTNPGVSPDVPLSHLPAEEKAKRASSFGAEAALIRALPARSARRRGRLDGPAARAHHRRPRCRHGCTDATTDRPGRRSDRGRTRRPHPRRPHEGSARRAGRRRSRRFDADSRRDGRCGARVVVVALDGSRSHTARSRARARTRRNARCGLVRPRSRRAVPRAGRGAHAQHTRRWWRGRHVELAARRRHARRRAPVVGCRDPRRACRSINPERRSSSGTSR